MSALDIARRHHRERRALVAATAAAGARMWRQVNPADLSGSWAQFLVRLLTVLEGAQFAAANQAEAYTAAVLAAQGVDVPPAGVVSAYALAGIASDGRPLASLLQWPVIAAKAAISQGATVPRAMATGQASLGMILRTQVSDAGRVADGVAVAVRPSVGYARMVTPPACSRCLILAGRFYRHNAGFARHPQCDCIHVPAHGEKAARDEGLISNPKAYFESLSPAEQDKVFTTAGAQAIRDGADIAQVVNARRGMSFAGARITAEERRALVGGDRARLRTSTVFGREVFTTTEGTTTRGIAGQRLGARETGVKNGRYRRARTPRLMPESIYQLATDPADAVRLLRRFGYIV